MTLEMPKSQILISQQVMFAAVDEDVDDEGDESGDEGVMRTGDVKRMFCGLMSRCAIELL